MKWEDLKYNVYHEDGSLRDIYIRNVTHEDWKNWVEFVNAKYPIDFKIGNAHRGNKIDFDLVTSYWQNREQECLSASIDLGNIILNTFFFDKEEIDNDLAPAEIKSLEDHYKLLRYLSNISILLGRQVELTEESYQKTRQVLMAVDKDKVTFEQQRLNGINGG